MIEPRTRHAPRRIAAVALWSALLLVATACGGGAPNEQAQTTSPAPTGAETPQTEATTGSASGTAAPSGDFPDAAAFYQGKTIEWIVPYDPGGGYDTYSRLIAPYLAECTGAQIVVRNEPGAGGLLATNQTFVAEPNGLRIQIINSIGAVSAQLAGAEGARYDMSEFSWLARVAAQPNVLVVASDSDIQSFEDIISATQEDPIRFVATGPGSNEYINSTILPQVYDFAAEVITGFQGSGEARAAVIRGNADAHILPLDSQLDAIQAGEVRPVAVIGREPSDEISDTPTVYEFTPESDEQQRILDALVSMVETGRAVAAPPGVAENRVGFLRDAFLCALGNEELLAETQEAQRPITALPGEEMAELVTNVLDAPPAFAQLVKDSF